MVKPSARTNSFAAVCLLVPIILTVVPVKAVERITFKDKDGKSRSMVGQSQVTAADGGRLFLADDGQLWTIQKDCVESFEEDDSPLVPLTAEEVSKRLLEELPSGFAVYRTAHYVIVHNTNEAYVKWVGGLFEQLHRGFYAYWKNHGWALPEPQFPLVALVFANREGYDAYSQKDVGAAAQSTIGYYNLQTNRMITYNVPDAERQVATIVHEATHQIAYNSSMNKRFADNPMWVTEGMAVFFESPDFSTNSGWRSIGKVNRLTMDNFRKYLPRRDGESLTRLLSDDMRFRQPALAADAYSEAWALTYFLVRTRKKEYIQYLRALSEQTPLKVKSPRERIEEFERIFKTDLATLDKQFVKHMLQVN